MKALVIWLYGTGFLAGYVYAYAQWVGLVSFLGFQWLGYRMMERYVEELRVVPSWIDAEEW